jgi:hypothetical protein
LLSDAIVFSFSFFLDRFFTASARAGPEVEMFPYQDFSRKSSSFDCIVGLGMIILLSTGRRRFGRQAGGKKSSGRGKAPLSLTGSFFSPMLRPRSSSSWKRQALGALHPFLIRILRKHPHGAPTDQAGRDAKSGSS